MSPAARRACLVGYVLAGFLAFPHPVAGGVLDLGLWLAPAAPLLLLLGVRGLPARRALRVGFAAGLAAHAAILHWIYVVTVTYGHGAPPVGVVAVLGLAAYVATFVALFAAGAAWLAERDRASPVALAALWTAIEYLRSFVFTGFPWATLGYAWHGNAWLLGLASWTGVYGLSFTAVLGAAAALDLAGGRRRRGALALAAVAGLHVLGAGSGDRAADGETLRIAVLQGNIDQGIKWSPEWAGRTLAVYAELTRSAAAEGARLVVWPETAAPGSPDASAALHDALAALARETGSVLVVGAVGVEGFDASTGEPTPALRYFDSAYLVSGEGVFLERYDKTHLVPFGEYLPFRALLGRFVKALATGIATGDVSAGEAPRALRLPPGLGPEPPVTAGVPICYELLFPDLVRRFVGDGARVLLAITNDAWYGRTGAPYQFLAITALRSAETRTWTARAANTGVSAFIDSRGRVRARTPIFERGFLVEDVPLRPPGEATTFYVRHGDVFAIACWVGALGALAEAARRGRRKQAGDERG